MEYAKKVTQSAMIAAVLASLTLLASPGLAERPREAAADGGICEALSDATPGLESLCVNYCEARDCPNSDDQACDSVLANYDRRRSDGDPEMPCLLTCPCFTAEDLRNHPADLVACTQHVDPGYEFSGIFDEIATSGAATANNYTQEFYNCLYADSASNPPFFFRSIDRETAVYCRELVDAEIAARGFTCDPLF